MEWITVLPNLSIGVISVLALGYVTLQFIVTLDKRAKAHEDAMTERESALRTVEKEIRSELVRALKESTTVISENSKIMQRIVNHLDTR